mgnify:CR=1 FL=1
MTALMRPRRWLRLGCSMAICLPMQIWAAETATFDMIFHNGTVVDGSGATPFVASVGVRDGRLWLKAEDDQILWRSEKVIDVSGYIVAPGFIDLHTHARADLLDSERAQMVNYLTQGVTTVVIGNDGDGAVDVAARAEKIKLTGSGPNVIQYVGHSSLRRRVLDRTDRPATPEELETMKTLLRDALAAGARGLSSGLFYADASYATTEEMIALCKVVADYGGRYDTHIRAESSRGIGLHDAVEEAIRIGRESGVHVHIAHIKALGKGVWNQAPAIIKMVNDARAEGIQITADQYPWTASSTQLKSALLSREWQTGDWRAQLTDVANRSAILADIAANIERRGGPESLLIVDASDPSWVGLRLDQIAVQIDGTAEEAAAAVLVAGNPRVVSFNMQEVDIEAFMRQPWVATSSDGTNGHPRKYASFPRKYRVYVQERAVLNLPAFVRSSSGLSADILGLQDRGYIRDGWIADLVIFDEKNYRDKATFTDWDRLSEGVEYLLVNGTPVIQKGVVNSVRPGKIISSQRDPMIRAFGESDNN